MPEDDSILRRRAPPPELTVAYGAEPEQIMEVRVGAADAADRPLIILIHGGFWRPDIDRVHARPMADALALQGWTVALPEYSRVARDPEPTLRDLAVLLAQAPQRTTNHNGRVVLIGHSAGGHLALWAAAARICPALAGTVALGPAADLLLAHELGLGNGAVERFLGCEPVSRPDIDPRQMQSPTTPTAIVHGVDDAIVPIAVSESYVVTHPGTRLTPVAEAGHFALIDPDSLAWPTVVAELSRVA